MEIPNRINNRSHKIKRNLYMFFSILIAIFLILPDDITWARDRGNYLNYAEFSELMLQNYLNNGVLSLLSNEPLFLLLNMFLENFLSPENIIKFIIISSIITVAYSLGKITNYNFFVLVLILLVPQVIKNHIIHLRQGLALGIYLLGIVSINKYAKSLKYMAVFIHISLAFLILFEILDKVFKKIKLSFSLRLFVSSTFLVFIIGLIPNLVAIVGNRRISSYDFSMGDSVSGLGFLFWLIVGSLFILFAEKNKINIIASYGIIFYLMSYFFLDFGARIFENIIPLIIAGTLTLKNSYIKLLCILLLITYSSVIWFKSGLSFLI
ncbi:hypothetical protein B4064_1769 [Caldibacillus thermoamylovorans]|uniref:EpsG family protein n=1 Tax=Caldibacillus thermoamylovorans TaxID=35841 RepID=UPI0005A467F2|nr:EpsG family protein [Caldibacillus thermoamylovorans]KIO68279.1 hypothetical protein B4064_1769 [Caldibacillus thermoamylovorans]